MPSVPTLMTALAAAMMMHAAYSCLHYRAILEDLDLLEDGSGYSIPPKDVYVEVALAFGILLFAEMSKMGSFQSVEVNVKEGQPKHRRLEAPSFRTRKFDVYNHRAKML
mmetsp:Transcript_17991/g.49917  ORF Transcript_17991/g.49917 Transcript_17991/m.49917 type:complete len:109 (-) Transcript_17991:739-1065(-)